MIDREKIINELVEHIESALAVDSDYVDCVRTDLLQTVVGLLKEHEEKPLRCDKCSYHREDGWCGMHRLWVKETDYCSLGAWEGW